MKNMKWLLTLIGLAASLLLFSPFVTAQAMDYGYHSYGSNDYATSNDDFTLGYRQGYDHGFSDRRAGLDFDFEHSAAFQHGTSDFQSGYEQGYTDAYNRRPSQVENEHRSAMVEIFDDTGFQGNRMSLRIGNYNSIDLDDVQSMRINGDVRVILFNERNFEGKSVTLTADTPSLRFMQSGPFWTFGITRHHTGSMIIESLR